MNIGIIGTGNMGSGLGKLWAEQGHKLIFSYSRDTSKLEQIANSTGSNASVGTPTEAFSLQMLFSCLSHTVPLKMHSKQRDLLTARFCSASSMLCYRI
jgi:predicted dinucleotide-binding enzyme